MKSVTLILVLFLFLYSTGRDEYSKIIFSLEQCINNEETVTMCHMAIKGKEVQWSEITVPLRSLPSHLCHGDHITASSCNCEYSEQLIVYKSY